MMQRLDSIQALLETIHTQGAQMAFSVQAELDALETQVGELETVADSSMATMDGIKAILDKIIAEGGDVRGKLVEFRDRLEVKEQALVAANLRNTIAEDEEPGPEPEPEPEPGPEPIGRGRGKGKGR